SIKPQARKGSAVFCLLYFAPSLGSSCVRFCVNEPASTYLPWGMVQASACKFITQPCKTFDCADPVGRGRCDHWLFPAREHGLEAFLVSTGVVALAEIGDKTQLLAFMLSARYRKAWPIIFGILIATIVN